MARRHSGEFWYCNVCQAQNHETDGECQFCECGGRECQRDNCSDPRHFEGDPDLLEPEPRRRVIREPYTAFGMQV